MGIRAGMRDRLVGFYAPSVTEDAHGMEQAVFALAEQAWASVRFGTSAERREQAQERAEQMATFRVLSTSVLRTASGTWEIEFDGERWGISGPPAQAGAQGEELEFTARRRGV